MQLNKLNYEDVKGSGLLTATQIHEMLCANGNGYSVDYAMIDNGKVDLFMKRHEPNLKVDRIIIDATGMMMADVITE